YVEEAKREKPRRARESDAAVGVHGYSGLWVRTVAHEPAVAADQLAVHVQHREAADVAELALGWRPGPVRIARPHIPWLARADVETHRGPLPTPKDGIILPQPGDDFHRGEGPDTRKKTTAG